MTKWEILEALENWADDTEIEVMLPTDQGNILIEITGVEEMAGRKEQCALYTGMIRVE